MDTKSRILIVFFLILVAGVTVWKYKLFMIERDFVIYNNISCDPYNESCFAYICAEGDKECDATPFKRIEKNARFIEVCNMANAEECPELSCGVDEEGCLVTTCSEDVLEEGERCVKYDAQSVVYDLLDSNIATTSTSTPFDQE